MDTGKYHVGYEVLSQYYSNYHDGAKWSSPSIYKLTLRPVAISGDLQLGKGSPQNIEKTSVVNTSYHKQRLPHSEFYQNLCLLTSPSLKLKELEISLYLDKF